MKLPCLKKSIACFTLVLPLFLAACSSVAPSPLNQVNFDKIHDDMSPTDVRVILGNPTDSRTEPIPIIGGSQTTYTYHDNIGEAVIVFKNDQVKEKHASFSSPTTNNP